MAINAIAWPAEPGESIDLTLRRLKKACDKSGFCSDFKRREHFIPKGQRRRTKSIVARKRNKAGTTV